MRAILKNYKEIAKVINAYVKDHGTSECKNGGEIKELLIQNGVILNTMYQPTDLCYNRTTKNDVSDFADAIHLFEYVGWDSFRILGEGFPYNGIIERRPKGQKDSIVVGRWENGKCFIN